MKVLENDGKVFLLIERVSYGQPGQPEEKREYHLFEQNFPVGFIEDFKNVVREQPGIDGIIILDPIEGIQAPLLVK